MEEGGEVTVVAFPVVLDAEQIFPDAARVFETTGRKRGGEHFAPVEHIEKVRHLVIAHVHQLIERKLAVRLSGMTANERELAILRPIRIPFQEVLDLRRLAVFVGAEDTDIEIEARVIEIVRVAAVKSDLLFGSKDKPYVVVTLETIKVIGAALVKRDHVGTQSSLLFAFSFDIRDRLLARGGGLLRAHPRLQRGGNPRRYVLDRHQDVQLEIGRARFFRLGLRVESVAHVVVLLAADLLEGIEADVMIRDDKAVRRNERAATAGVETDARFLEMLEPLRCRLETILFLELFERWRVEEPHPFISDCSCSEAN